MHNVVLPSCSQQIVMRFNDQQEKKHLIEAFVLLLRPHFSHANRKDISKTY